MTGLAIASFVAQVVVCMLIAFLIIGLGIALLVAFEDGLPVQDILERRRRKRKEVPPVLQAGALYTFDFEAKNLHVWFEVFPDTEPERNTWDGYDHMCLVDCLEASKRNGSPLAADHRCFAGSVHTLSNPQEGQACVDKNEPWVLLEQKSVWLQQAGRYISSLKVLTASGNIGWINLNQRCDMSEYIQHVRLVQPQEKTNEHR